MCMLKLLLQKLQIRLSWLLGKQLTSRGTAKDYSLGTTGDIQAFVFQGETDDHHPWEQLAAQDRNVAASFT